MQTWSVLSLCEERQVLLRHYFSDIQIGQWRYYSSVHFPLQQIQSLISRYRCICLAWTPNVRTFWFKFIERSFWASALNSSFRIYLNFHTNIDIKREKKLGGVPTPNPQKMVPSAWIHFLSSDLDPAVPLITSHTFWYFDYFLNLKRKACWRKFF